MTNASISLAGTRLIGPARPIGPGAGPMTIVSILDAALAGVARGHPIAAVIEDAAGQQGPRVRPLICVSSLA
jgi:hypothetical protein